MQVLELRCRHCANPYMHIYNGVVTVDSRHGGHIHTNSISLSLLLQLAEISAAHLDYAEMLEAQRLAGLPLHEPIQQQLDGWVIPLRCFRRECSTPWAILVGGAIHIVSWHRQEKHCNQLPFETVKILTGR